MSESFAQPTARRLRVCMMVPYDISPEAGGVKQHAVHLMAGLTRLGDEVTLVGPASQPVQAANTVGFGGIVNIPGNGSDNHMALLCSPLRLQRFFKQNTFDVLHLHEPEVPALTYWTAWMQRHVPQVVTFHAYSERPKWMARLARRAVGKLLFRNVRHGVAVSEGARALAQQSFAKPIEIIPNGVDHRLFRPADGHGSELQHDEQGGPLRLLFVGGVHHPRKGARYLFEALHHLRAQGIFASVDIVGAKQPSGEAKVALPEGVRHHVNVSTEKLSMLYRSCDALVAPATGQESFGIILLEAMASGKPIIASDINGYRAVLRASGGKGALMVPAADGVALSRAIAQLNAMGPHARQLMGAHNRANIGPFTWDTITQKLRRIYLDSIEQANG